MNKFEQAQAAVLIQQMGTVYREQLTPFTVEVYVDALQGFPLETVQEVIKAACKTKRFRPQPVELVESAERMTFGSTSLERAARMFKELIVDGVETSPDYIVDDPRFGKALAGCFGSLAALARSRLSDAELSKRFLNTYRETFTDDMQYCLIKGVSRNPEPWLVYLGNWEVCDKAAHELMPNRRHFPRRHGEVKRLEHKAEPQYVSREEMQKTFADLLKKVNVE